MQHKEAEIIISIKNYLDAHDRESAEENFDEEGNVLYCLEGFEKDFYVNISTTDFFNWVSEWIDEQNEGDNNELNIIAKDFYDKFTNDVRYSFVVNDIVYVPFCHDIDDDFNTFYESELS